MTLLRNDLRSEDKSKPQTGWLDNIITKKPKDAPETGPAAKARPTREAQPQNTPDNESAPEKAKPQPVAAAPVPTPAPSPARVERTAPSTALPYSEPEVHAPQKVSVPAVVYGAVFTILAVMASLQGKDGLLGALVLTTLGLLGLSVLGIFHREGLKKAFWEGFAVFGLGYMLLAFVPALSNDGAVELPTYRLINFVYAKATDSAPDPRGSFVVMRTPPAVETPPLAPEPGSEAAKNPTPQTASLFALGELRQVTVVGHCCFTLLFAFIGSAISKVLYRNRLVS